MKERKERVVLDKDLAKVGIALRQAAKQARKIAIHTNTLWSFGRMAGW